MPRSTREYLLRYCDQALNNIDRTLERLYTMKTEYEDVEPDYAKYVEMVAVQIMAAKEFLSKFRTEYM